MYPVIAFTKVRGPGGWMSNMSPHQVVYTASPPLVTCRTAEHLFQARRIDPDLRGPPVFIVLAERSPMSAKLKFKALVAEGLELKIEPWSEDDLANMRLVVGLKLDQHPDLREQLSATGEGTLIEDTTRRVRPDQFWGAVSVPRGTAHAWDASDGTWWIGKNWLGRIWMDERSSGRLL